MSSFRKDESERRVRERVEHALSQIDDRAEMRGLVKALESDPRRRGYLEDQLGEGEGKKGDATLVSEVVGFWVARARSVVPMDDGERREVTDLVRRLYDLRKWKVLPDSRVAFVPSTFVMLVLSSLLTVYWSSKKTIRQFSKAATDDSRMNKLRTYSSKCRNVLPSIVHPVNKACEHLRCMVTTPLEVSDEAVSDLLLSEGKIFDLIDEIIQNEKVRESLKTACSVCTDDGIREYCPSDSVTELGSETIVNMLGRTEDILEMGNLSSGIPACVDYLTRKGVRVDPELTVFSKMASVAGPWIAHPEFCVVSARPDVLKVDNSGRLHSESGPACAWSDGTRLYCLKGVRMGSRFVERPSDITADQLEKMAQAQRDAVFELSPKSEQVLYEIREMGDADPSERK